MKYTFILLTASIFIFVACKKKPIMEHCYACMRYDSIRSNIAYYNVTPYFENARDTMCHQTDATIKYYMKTHYAIPDTLIKTKNFDTLVVLYYSNICELN